jgi:hypothetical protein
MIPHSSDSSGGLCFISTAAQDAARKKMTGLLILGIFLILGLGALMIKFTRNYIQK